MKSILLIGLGKFGKHVAKELSENGHEVMAVDIDEEKVNAVLPFVTNAVIGDSTEINFLNTLGVKNFDLCIVTIASCFQDSLETTSLLSELGAKKVISRAASNIQSKFLLRNGANEVVYPEKQLAKWTAIRYTADNILDYLELDDKHGIFEVSVPEEFLNKTIGELDIRKKYEINVIALKKEREFNVLVTPDTVLTEDMTMYVVGELKSLQKCFKI